MQGARFQDAFERDQFGEAYRRPKPLAGRLSSQQLLLHLAIDAFDSSDFLSD
jgi:hypothetical protein